MSDIRSMGGLRNSDLAWCVNRLPKTIRSALKDNPAKLFIAGGYIRSRITGEKPSDIDLFVTDEGMVETLIAQFKLDLDLCDKDIFKTQNARTIKTKIPIQIITRWIFETPEDVIHSFDFTIAQSIIWHDGENWRSMIHHDYYADLAGRSLVYTHPQRNEDAGGSALRILKYYQKGFRAPLASYAGVMARIMMAITKEELDVCTEFELTDIISNMLREVDPSVDPEHLLHYGGDDD